MIRVLKMRPLLKEKVWGGRKLERSFRKALPRNDRPFGEAWEVADLPEGQSTVDGGPLDGVALGELARRLGPSLVGTSARGERFPLLVKLLDAAADLSIQVHPGPEHVGSMPGARSKDECWLILQADPGGAIYHGFRRPTSREEFRDAVAEGRVTELLQRVEVAPGDVFRIPPGTIHAICAGVVLLEIQEPSDTTYRVYDYGRPGLDGMPRELHLDEAMAVARFEPSLPELRGEVKEDEHHEVLASVDAYRIERFVPKSDLAWSVAPHGPQVVHVLRGRCVIDDVVVGPADTVVVPAGIGRVFLWEPDGCELIVAGLGGPALIDA